MAEKQKIAESMRILIVWTRATNEYDSDARLEQAQKLKGELEPITPHVHLCQIEDGRDVNSCKANLWDRRWLDIDLVVTFGGSGNQFIKIMGAVFPAAKMLRERDFDDQFVL